MTTLFADLLFIDGVDLSPDKADALERRLESQPEEMGSRVMLLGYYFARSGTEARERRQRHVLWIPANRPEVDITGSPPCLLSRLTDGQAYVQARDLWIGHTGPEQTNTAILENAAKFFTRFEKEIAADLYERARAIDPDNPEWSIATGHLHMLAGIGASASEKKQHAAAALKEFEAAYRQTSDEAMRFHQLRDLAGAALNAGNAEKAKAYAEELLQLAPEHKKNFDYGNAIHDGNVVLGRLAVAERDVEKSKEFLLAAGRTPGSPQLGSFGPNMTLAYELLRHGEKEVVLHYLKLCSRFWEDGQEELRNWEKQIRWGRTPDFGPHLAY